MAPDTVTPDTVTFNTIISALERAGEWERAGRYSLLYRGSTRPLSPQHHLLPLQNLTLPKISVFAGAQKSTEISSPSSAWPLTAEEFDFSPSSFERAMHVRVD
eukprot:10574-Prorocentrum_minimum.AAC.1